MRHGLLLALALGAVLASPPVAEAGDADRSAADADERAVDALVARKQNLSAARYIEDRPALRDQPRFVVGSPGTELEFAL